MGVVVVSKDLVEGLNDVCMMKKSAARGVFERARSIHSIQEGGALGGGRPTDNLLDDQFMFRSCHSRCNQGPASRRAAALHASGNTEEECVCGWPCLQIQSFVGKGAAAKGCGKQRLK
jgi:hypothetical protein